MVKNNKNFWLVCLFTIITLLTFSFGFAFYFYQNNKMRLYIPSVFNVVLHKKLRILITSIPQAFGELSVSKRMANTLADMGYGSVVLLDKKIPSYISAVDFDFVIHLRPETEINTKFFNLFIVNYYTYCNTKKAYDALLSVVPIEITRRRLENKNIPICPFYFAEHSTKFCESSKKKLFFCGQLWDQYRKEYCSKLYRLLDQTGYFRIYGAPKFWEKLNLKSYRGLISREKDALLNVMQKTGVALVLHSSGHFDNNTTSARIFEALAASNVIICDRLPFIVENFGDTVLYIDRNASPEEIFRQIDNHMQWILSHQKEAIEMARKSHKIFLEKFTLEKELKNVIDFYEKCKKEKNKRKS